MNVEWEMIIKREEPTTDGIGMITLFEEVFTGGTIFECINKFEKWIAKNNYDFIGFPDFSIEDPRPDDCEEEE
jgi:hypothetical protein